MASVSKKTRKHFVCSSCGSSQVRWMGKCPSCGAWDTLEEVRLDAGAARDPHQGLAEGWKAAAGGGMGGGDAAGQDPAAFAGLDAPKAVRLVEAKGDIAASRRFVSNIGELDRVLGGGLVPGSVVLLGGDPGIGKSTLLLQAMGGLAGAGARTLYVTSEESAEQVRMRAERLGVVGGEATERRSDEATEGKVGAPGDDVFVLADTNLARIVEQARRVEPDVLVLDSIQMVYKADLDASPGSVAQLRRCCTELVYLAKVSGMAVVLVGHVTKEGSLAGPKLLEHLVDVVLQFEGDRYHAHRVVRSIKNRFGTTLEIGLFTMGQRGLVEVPDGASVAAGSLGAEPRAGSCVAATVTGSRCVLVEMQALAATGFPGAVKRKASGVDASRLAMLIAVLEQRADLRLHDRDVFASAVGGVRVIEPAADAALALAIAGAHLNRALPPATAAVGEVGLGGELRPVTQMEARVREAARLGYRRLIVPRGEIGFDVPAGLELVGVGAIGGAMEELG